MLELAARRCAGHVGVELRPADAVSLPVDDARFDAVLCVQVLEYVTDPTVALAEMHRALRPGGRVVVWDVDWATVSLHALDSALTERVLLAWDERLTHPSLPRTLAPRFPAAGFGEVHMEAHSFSTCELDPETTAGPCSRSWARSWSDATGSPTSRPRHGSPSSSSSASRAEFYFSRPSSASRPRSRAPRRALAATLTGPLCRRPMTSR